MYERSLPEKDKTNSHHLQYQSFFREDYFALSCIQAHTILLLLLFIFKAGVPGGLVGYPRAY